MTVRACTIGLSFFGMFTAAAVAVLVVAVVTAGSAAAIVISAEPAVLLTAATAILWITRRELCQAQQAVDKLIHDELLRTR